MSPQLNSCSCASTVVLETVKFLDVAESIQLNWWYVNTRSCCWRGEMLEEERIDSHETDGSSAA